MDVKDCFFHQKQILTLFGFSLLPTKKIVYKVYSYFVLFTLIIYPLFVIPEIIKLLLKSDFDEFCLSLIFEVGYVTTLLCICCIVIKKNKITTLIAMLTSDVYVKNFSKKHYDEELFGKCHALIIKQSYRFTIMSISAILACLLSSFTAGDNLKLPYGAGLPTEYFNFQTTFTIKFLVFTVIITIILLTQALYSNILVYLRAHCNCLQNRIKNILRDSVQNYHEAYINDELFSQNDPTCEILHKELKQIVIYHTGIIKLAEITGNIFNPITFIIFVGVAMVKCFALFHALTVPLFSFLFLQDTFFAVICFIIFYITSLRGEQIIQESLKLADACYDIEFIGTDIKFQKSLLLVMKISQKPLVQKVGSLQVLSLVNLVGIYQSIYSYFAFLRRIKENE